MTRTIAVLLVLPMLVLGACGQTTGDRALSGAGIGAGLGLWRTTRRRALGGALIGGAVGAGAGAITTPSQVDLGRPAWR